MERLVEVRSAKGLTQAEVARKMGTTQPYIARLENSANDPRLSTLLRYAAIVAGAALVAAILSELERPGKK
jgi:transcriptional regulator with XRE-family HTH domain